MPDSTAILAMLIAVSLKVLALVVMGAIAAWGLRRASAACRHALWTAVLASALIITATAPVPPMWAMPWGGSSVVPRLLGQGVPGLDSIRGGATPSAPRLEPAPPDEEDIAPPHASIGDVLVLGWMAGAVILAARIGAGLIALRWIAVRGRAIEAGLARAWLERLAGPTGTARRVRMIEIDALIAPATWGVFRPVIALPATARAWPAPRLEAALRHELAHVRRLDVLTQMGAGLCCALLWFHPAVWFAAARMRRERESACDDAALATGGPGTDYAEWLVALAEDVSRGGAGRSVPAAVAMTEGRELEGRLRAILDPATTRSTPRMTMASVPAGVLVATVTMAGLDVLGSTPSGATMPSDGVSLTAPAPRSAELPFGERVPLSIEQERWALARRFRPRDDREARAIARLQEATRHEKRHAMDFVRDRAIWALWVAREDEILAPLTGELASTDWRVRACAAWCLGVAGAAGAREELTERLHDPVWRVRAMAATALAGLADPRSTGDMLALLADPAWQVRLPAVEFLARVPTAAARAAVRARLDDPHVAVRSAAMAALGESGIP